MKQGDKVKVHYTGTLNDGTIFDSSEGREPLEFTIGNNQVIKGFDEGIRGMKLNEEKTIKISAKEAYGEVDKRMIINAPKEKFPNDVQVGGHLMLKGPNGEQIPAVVKEIKDKVVVIDLNHPLAGKELNFKVKVVSVN